MPPFAAESSLPTQYEVYPFIDPSRFKGKLTDKVVVVTGASAGIGKATTHAFAAAGASIACVARRQAELADLVADLKSKHAVPALAVAADISTSMKAKEIIEQVESELGPIDILLNCAGITRYGTLAAEEDFETWWRVLEVNLYGPTALIHAVLPSMIKRRAGIVMTVASTSGSQDVPYNTAYAVAKAGVIKLHQDLAVELRRHNIQSYSVHPGSIPTELAGNSSAVNMKSVGEEPEMQQAMEAFKDMKYQTLELPASTFVALVADQRCQALNGMYIDAEQDLSFVLQEAEKEGAGRIGKERLYHLKVDEL